MSEKKAEFTALRAMFWPIHGWEVKKFLPMIVMMFCFLFNYTIMRDTKDTLILTAAGAEALPFLKFWGVLPMSILFVLCYAKLSNILKPTTLFYVSVLPFLIFFTAFGFILYPNRAILCPNQLCDWLSTLFQGRETLLVLVEVVRHWIYALFYILAELWGSMGVSLLFWQFANHITKTEEAKRFYPRFTQYGNLSLIVSGLVIIYFSDIRDSLPVGVDAWGVTLKWLMGAIGVACAVIVLAYRWMNRYILTDLRYYNPEEVRKTEKSEKPKLSLKESLIYLMRSKYLLCIALLVLGYGISINLFEVVLKGLQSRLYPNENDLNTFYGHASMWIGVVTFVLVAFSGQMVRKLGWKISALITPVIIMTAAAIFFILVIYRQELADIFPFSPLFIAVMCGTALNVLNKATKYALFDPTKEMSYIPLDQEAKVKGKAAVDVVGARLGKSGGGLILQVVLIFGAIMQNLPILFVMIAFVVTVWIVAVVMLYRRYQALTAEKEKSAA